MAHVYMKRRGAMRPLSASSPKVRPYTAVGHTGNTYRKGLAHLFTVFLRRTRHNVYKNGIPHSEVKKKKTIGHLRQPLNSVFSYQYC